MELIDGKKIATQVKQELADEVKRMKAAGAKTPHLVAVLVGNDPARSEERRVGKECRSRWSPYH